MTAGSRDLNRRQRTLVRELVATNAAILALLRPSERAAYRRYCRATDAITDDHSLSVEEAGRRRDAAHEAVARELGVTS